MVADPKSEALFALHRFGFGPRGGSAATISADPRGALLADIERPGAAALTVNMPSSGESARAALEVREARRAARLARVRLLQPSLLSRQAVFPQLDLGRCWPATIILTCRTE